MAPQVLDALTWTLDTERKMKEGKKKKGGEGKGKKEKGKEKRNWKVKGKEMERVKEEVEGKGQGIGEGKKGKEKGRKKVKGKGEVNVSKLLSFCFLTINYLIETNKTLDLQ